MESKIKSTGFFPLSDVHDNGSAMTKLLAVLKGSGAGETGGNRDRKIKG